MGIKNIFRFFKKNRTKNLNLMGSDESLPLSSHKRVYDISEFIEEDIKRILNNLSNDENICFFDFFHPQWSDPGAYVTIEKYNENYMYMIGNHGWSSAWHVSNIDRLCRYILKNREYQTDTFYVYKKIKQKNMLDYNIQPELFIAILN